MTDDKFDDDNIMEDKLELTNEDDMNEDNKDEIEKIELKQDEVSDKEEIACSTSSEDLQEDNDIEQSEKSELDNPEIVDSAEVYSNIIDNSTAHEQSNCNEKDNDVFNYTTDNKKVHGGKNMSGKKITGIVLSAVVSVAVLVFAVIGVVSLVGNGISNSKASDSDVSITVPPASESNEDNTANATTGDGSGSIQNASTTDGATSVADVVENVMPSIVAVNCTVTSTTMDMFGQSYSQDAQSSGSGIIIGQNSNKTQLLIATNNHVVEDAKTVEIVFFDDESVTASIKGTDSSADLAVLAVNISDMKDSTKKSVRIATIGDSSTAKVGETAIAIGNALGYGQSVTVGIISALEREVSVEDCTMSLIQTDAAINPGNSGGALINSKGELIGINSVKYVSEDTEGIGYSIPISTAVPIINELMNYEEISDEEQGYLGIIGVNISSSFSLRDDIEGVVVKEVSENSPAAKGGLAVNDVIVKFAGRDVKSMEEIQSVLQKKKGGEEVEIVIKRLDKGEYVDKTLKVTLGARGDYSTK